MNLQQNIALKTYTTMRMGGKASFMAEAHSLEDVKEIYRFSRDHDLPVFVLGGGSNVIAHDKGYDGVVLLNKICGFEINYDDESTAVIRLGAGEIWDSVVQRTVDMGLSGIEAMSAIPGTAGAAPVQNIGAYGQELADTFVELEAYDSESSQVVIMTADDCDFSYRHSVFRGKYTGRYCILSVTLRLSRSSPRPPFYNALQKYFDENNISEFTPQIIRNAVMSIRFDKLPDPTKKPNSGSFFKNSIVDKATLERIRQDYAEVPNYPMGDNSDNYKVPTGWLIDRAGLRGELISGMRVHDKNALVLINESATGYADLSRARQIIIQAVKDKFGIQIEQEPLEIA